MHFQGLGHSPNDAYVSEWNFGYSLTSRDCMQARLDMDDSEPGRVKLAAHTTCYCCQSGEDEPAG